jgi:hypothetical protein
MKRLLTAGVAALVLVASQAAAVAPSIASLNVADRAASQSQTANEFEGMSPWVIAAIVAGIIAIIVAASNNDSPSSP